MQERWAVAANFVGRRLFRWGAKVRIVFSTGGDPSRVRVVGLNFYGRSVEAWCWIGDLRSFRPMLHADGSYATKEAAAQEAAYCDRARAFWGAKCPLLTWTQHREILRAAGK